MWGWLIAACLILLVGLAMGELASSMPTRFASFHYLTDNSAAVCIGGHTTFLTTSSEGASVSV